MALVKKRFKNPGHLCVFTLFDFGRYQPDSLAEIQIPEKPLGIVKAVGLGNTPQLPSNCVSYIFALLT